jgi:hypothetical protein
MTHRRHRTRRGAAGAIVALAALAALAAFAAVLAGPSAMASGARAHTTKGPYITGLTDTGVEVRVELDTTSPATLEVQAAAPVPTGDGGGVRTSTGAPSSMHVLSVDGLSASTRYAYIVRAGADIVGRGTFTTAPGPTSTAPVTFVVAGDNRSDDVAHAAVVRAVAQTPADFLVNTGDLVENGGNAAMWQSFFDVESNLLRDRALFVSIGNHELFDDRSGAAFARYFGYLADDGTRRPYGTVRWGDVRFFFMNAMHDWSGGEERAWLERELGRADGEAGLVWRIAVTHHAPWSSGPHGGNPRLLEAHIPELLRAHKVDLLFGGHDHIYERGAAGGIKYIISGGGGAPPYRIEHKADTAAIAESTYHFVQVTAAADAIHIIAKRVDGSMLDECSFAKDKPWSCGGPAAAAASAASSDTSSGQRAEGDAAQSASRCGCSTPGAAGGTPALIGSGLAGAALALARLARRSRLRNAKGA